MGEEQVVELRIGCQPEPGVSGGRLLQSESAAFLFFNAVAHSANDKLGTAVVEFQRCTQTTFGGPNDEALPEHPLYNKGLRYYGVFEVLNSSWAIETMARARKSAQRILRDRFEDAYKDHDWSTRHFIFTFHDSTFECLARDLQVTIHNEPRGHALNKVLQKLARE
ncbi:MAG TPA: hypothetical protein VHY91_03455 [Pirellulales bacterium]|jgi:hypothetical protein|nr:hypothetical protein [Pirellulales bacterium]